MGLDITAYSKIRRVECGNRDGDCWPTHANLYPSADFPDHADGLTEGCYEHDSEYSFRAGSYSGYSAWRDTLAGLVGLSSPRNWNNSTVGTGKPFAELLYFSDCDGIIGPKTSAKLAADFAQYEAHARSVLDEYEMSKYREWMTAFFRAADGGVVCFH